MGKRQGAPETEHLGFHQVWPVLHSELGGIHKQWDLRAQLENLESDLWIEKPAVIPYRLAAEMTDFAMNLVKVFYEASTRKKRQIRRRNGVLRLVAAVEANAAARKQLQFLPKAAKRYAQRRQAIIRYAKDGDRIIADACRELAVLVQRIDSEIAWMSKR